MADGFQNITEARITHYGKAVVHDTVTNGMNLFENTYEKSSVEFASYATKQKKRTAESYPCIMSTGTRTVVAMKMRHVNSCHSVRVVTVKCFQKKSIGKRK